MKALFYVMVSEGCIHQWKAEGSGDQNIDQDVSEAQTLTVHPNDAPSASHPKDELPCQPPLPKDLIISSKSNSNRKPSVQIPEPMRRISHKNHLIPCP